MNKLPPEKPDGIELTKEQLEKFYDVYEATDTPRHLREQAV